jgi:hypothetical protein
MTRRTLTLFLLMLALGLGCGSSSTTPDGDENSITVDTSPDSLNASWTLSGPAGYGISAQGDLVLRSMAPGEYSIEWGAVAGWDAPADVAQTLVDGQTLTFEGSYTER